MSLLHPQPPPRGSVHQLFCSYHHRPEAKRKNRLVRVSDASISILLLHARERNAAQPMTLLCRCMWQSGCGQFCAWQYFDSLSRSRALGGCCHAPARKWSRLHHRTRSNHNHAGHKRFQASKTRAVSPWCYTLLNFGIAAATTAARCRHCATALLHQANSLPDGVVDGRERCCWVSPLHLAEASQYVVAFCVSHQASA